MFVDNDLVRVSFWDCGEGWQGDFNPDDPEDSHLLRLDVLVAADSGYEGEETDDPLWLSPPGGSICTAVQIETDRDTLFAILHKAADLLADEVQGGRSIKSTMDDISRWTAERQS